MAHWWKLLHLQYYDPGVCGEVHNSLQTMKFLRKSANPKKKKQIQHSDEGKQLVKVP